MAERGQFNHLFKPGQRKIEPPKSPHGSWWVTASPEKFTELAKTKIVPEVPFTLKPIRDDHYD